MRVRRNRRYIAGFLVTMLAIDLVELSFFFQGESSFYYSADFFLLSYLIISQTGLLAIWSGLGGRPVTLRFFATLVFVEIWCLLVPILTDNWFASKDLFNVLAPAFLLVAMPLWVGRLLGLRLVNIEENSQRIPPERDRFQFTIRRLLEWLTITAIFMGSLAYVFGKGEGFVLHVKWRSFAAQAACFAVLTLSMTWGVLGVRWAALRIVQVILAYVVLRCICGRVPALFDTPDLLARPDCHAIGFVNVLPWHRL